MYLAEQDLVGGRWELGALARGREARLWWEAKRYSAAQPANKGWLLVGRLAHRSGPDHRALRERGAEEEWEGGWKQQAALSHWRYGNAIADLVGAGGAKAAKHEN